MLPLILSLGHIYLLAHLMYHAQLNNTPRSFCLTGVALLPSAVLALLAPGTYFHRQWPAYICCGVLCASHLAIRTEFCWWQCNVKVWKVRFLCLVIHLFSFFIETINLCVSKESAMSVKSQTFTCWNAALKQGNQCWIGLSDCAHACEQIESFPLNVTSR